MLMTMVPFIAPGSGRLLFLPGIMALAGVPTLFALAVGARDLATAGRIHRATWIGGGIALAALWGAVALMNSPLWVRSEEHTSELQSLMRISYAVFCLQKKK